MTQATKDKAYTGEDAMGEGNGVESAYENASFEFKNILVEALLKDGDNYVSMTGVTDSKGNSVTKPGFINYNALLGVDEEFTSNVSYGSEKGIYFDTNCWRTTAGFLTVGGKVQFNNISGNMNKSGMMEYVPSGARYQAYLIKDVSGTTMGVAFEQIGAK